MRRRHFLFLTGILSGVAGCSGPEEDARAAPVGPQPPPKQVTLVEFDSSGQRTGTLTVPQVVKTDAEWRRQLSKRAYAVTRQKGTEFAFTGRYDKFYEDGVYRCVCCGTALFSSETKFNSGTGWPSFWAPIAEENVHIQRDLSLGMIRQEVLCALCDAHLGHVFDDGPPPTGFRCCINSAALAFDKSRS